MEIAGYGFLTRFLEALALELAAANLIDKLLWNEVKKAVGK